MIAEGGIEEVLCYTSAAGCGLNCFPSSPAHRLRRGNDMQSNKPRSTPKMAFAIFVAFLLTAMVASQPVRAKTKFKVIHTFHGKNGAFPQGVLVLDAAGNIYGTTGGGGTGTCGSQGLGCGTVFKLDKAGRQVWLHSFNGGNGYDALAGVLRDSSGMMFGTTLLGGDLNCKIDSAGCGTVFKLNKAGTKETVLHEFTGLDGLDPEALLVEDKAGNLFGTTYIGGEYGVGTVFKVDTGGNESVLYNFTGGSDGCAPYPGVTLDSAGNLYGVTAEGGNGFCNDGVGVVFEVDAAGHETVLHTFEGGDGATPGSVLTFDSQGNLYGTTGHGGGNAGCGAESGCGTVFKLTPQSGGTWSENVLYSFCSLKNCADGAEPDSGPLARDADGNIYGTTYFGGAHQNCDGNACGVVFKLDTSGKETVLHSFTEGSDGANPVAGLVMDGQGNLYGVTQTGGAACYSDFTCGVLFKVTP
jgi:uncharacterized repeat protein (TIGR03803 family)